MPAREPDIVPASGRRFDLHIRGTRRSSASQRLIIDPKRRHLRPEVAILPGTDIADVWDRFEVFEALHHSIAICNPMSSAELDEVVDAMGLSDTSRVLDVACGYGELLFRTANRAAISGTGIDLSPWMITAAADRAAMSSVAANLSWVLGEARDFTTDPAPNVAVCIGAEWIWHDFAGTVRALAERLDVGGLAVVGAARLHHDADHDRVRRERGRIETVNDMADQLTEQGLTPVHRVDPDDAGWDDYLSATADAAAQWSSKYPGQRAERWIDEQADWQAARERDREVIGWSVWIARKDVASQ